MVAKKYKRTLVDRMLKYLDGAEALIIYGSRQVGKTTLLEYLMENHLPKGNTFYMDLERPDLLEICNKGTDAVYSHLLGEGASEKERICLLIDEMQYMGDPSKFIKLLVDHHKNIKLLATGSSLLGIRQKLAQSLAGRAMAFELYPLSFEEFLRFREKRYVLLPENADSINKELVPLAEEFIRFGGFPKVVLEPDLEKKKGYLSQIINTYVRKDVRDAGNMGDISSFNRLLGMLAQQSGGILNMTELAGTAGISRPTVQHYLSLLEGTFVMKRVAPYSKNLRSELSKNPKIYMLDTGMMHLLWLKDFPNTIHGSSFETFVFLELYKAGLELNFWRTSGGQEVDFVVEGKRLHALEAKLSYSQEGGRALAAFARRYPSTQSQVCLYGKPQESFECPWEAVKRLEGEMKGGKAAV